MIFVSYSIEKKIIPWSYRVPFVPPNLCTPTESNLYLTNSLAAAVFEILRNEKLGYLCEAR